jgi:hypothetical protein
VTAADIVASWLDGLAARGVTFTVRDDRLRVHPPRAYRRLTQDEVMVLNVHRAAIKQRVRGPVSASPTTAVEPTTCPFCYQTPARCTRLQARDLATWRSLHANDPAEVSRRDEEADRRWKGQMTESFRRLRDGDPNPLEDFIDNRRDLWVTNRNASGKVCCKDPHGNAHAAPLCPDCKARAGVMAHAPARVDPNCPVHGTLARAAEHDPLAGYRPALDKLAPPLAPPPA